MNKKKPKIAVIGLKGLPAFGGAATVGEKIIEQLKDKYDFTVYATSSHTHFKTGRYNNYRQIVFREISFKRLNSLYYYIISALHAVLFGKYNLIHLHHRDAAFIMLLLKIKYKVLLTTHGTFGVRYKWKRYRLYFNIQVKYFVGLANVITCVSRNEQRQFKNIQMRDVNFIPNGINDIIIFKSLPSVQYKNFIFFGAGRIIPTKGCHILLEALHEIDFKGKLIIAGDINQLPHYRDKLISLSKGLDVEFIGLILDKNILLSYLNNSFLFVFPSSREAMSVMLLEGASVKTPIICSNIIENKDVFDDSEVLFFDTDDYIDLAKKIRWAIDNEDLMHEKAHKASHKLMSNFRWCDIAKKYKKIYDNLTCSHETK